MKPPRMLLPVIVLAVFVLPMNITGVAIALPRIAADLGTSPALLQWVVNGFTVAFAAATLVWGVLSDRIGYRTTFRLGVLIVLAGTIGGAAAPSLPALDLARVVTGVGTAGVFTGAAAMLSNSYEGQARSQVFAIFGAVVGLGLAFGPTVSGLLIATVGWRGVFVVIAALLGLTFLGSLTLPPVGHHRDPDRKVVDFGLLRNRHFLALCLVPVAGAIGYVPLLGYLPVTFSAIASLSAGASGLLLLPMTLPVLVGPILAARLIRDVSWISSMTIIYAALACLILGDLGLLLLAPGVSVAWTIVPMLLAGFGFGLTLGLVDGEALATVPPRNSGTAAGVLNFMRVGSEAIFLALYAAALAWLISQSIEDPSQAQKIAAGGSGDPAAYADAFHTVLISLAALVAVTAVAIGLLHRARLRSAEVLPVCPSEG